MALADVLLLLLSMLIHRSDALQLPWFVKTETFKKTLSFPQIKPHLDAHKEWVAQLREEGKCSITSGYRVDADGKPGGGGLMLFAAEDYAAAQALVLCDPLIANDCVDWQLNQWIADVGDISLVDGGAWYTNPPSATPPENKPPRASPPAMSAANDGGSRVVLEPDYRLAATLAGGAGLVTLGTPLGLGVLAGAPLGALAAFLASRTAAVRFVFDTEAFEVMTEAADGGAEPSGRENFAVGGRNRWAYSSIVEWAMYPSPDAPVLVYFRETQTRGEEGTPQGHLFPVLVNPEGLRAQLEQRVGSEKRTEAPPRL